MTTRDVTIEIKQGSDVSPVAKCVQVASHLQARFMWSTKQRRLMLKALWE